MKNLIYLISIFIIVSCNNEHKNNSERTISLKMSIDSLKLKSKICVSEDSLCATANYTFPVFYGKDSIALNQFIINDLNDKLVEKDSIEIPTLSIKEIAQKFINTYEKDNNNYWMPWTEEVKVKVLSHDENIYKTKTDIYNFTGGAHPNTWEFYNNYDLALNRKLNLEDVFKPKFDEKLLAVAEKTFRKNEKIDSQIKLDDKAGYFFENGKFILTDNFLLTKDGIKFVYNNYEIKAYAYGRIELFIPKAEIADIILEKYF
jgi:hypothetical protein